MDEINDQPHVIIQNHPFPKPSMKFLVILFLILMASVPVGVYLYTNFPKTQTKNFTPVPAKTTPTKPRITIACPVEKQFCQQATVINEGNIFGYGFNLPEGTKILSVFEGLLTDQPKPPERSDKQPILYLTDKEQNEAIYSFYGSVSVKVPAEKVEQGVELGKIGPGTFPPYPPLSGLNFFLVIKDKNGLMLPFETK